jgi:hypothetical protein
MRFEEDNTFPVPYKPDAISSSYTATGSSSDNERFQDIRYITDSSAIGTDTSTTGTDILTLRLRPKDGSMIKTESHDTEYKIVRLYDKVVEGGVSYYLTE